MKFPLLFLALITFARAENIVFPPESGIVDVKSAYGAKGDGATDDTDALQKAIFENKGKMKTLYFPNGTYLVSRTLFVGGETFSREQIASRSHSSDRFVNFQGQSEAGAILRLKDNCPGFDDPKKPKSLLSTYDGQGTGDVMHTYVRNMTFDIGSGNAGAAGLRYLSNNTGGIYDVTIRSSDPELRGSIGLDLRQGQQGPELIRNVTITGFDRGVHTQDTFAIVFEHLTLRNQRELGIFMEHGRVTVRNLASDNKVPVVSAPPHDHFTLVGGTFTGGSPEASAILATSPRIFLRDIKQTGYGAILEYKGTKNPATSINEWTPGTVGLFTEKPTSLRLPIKETPVVPWEEDFKKWIILDNSQPDDTASIQAAIDEGVKNGATTVCFLPGEKQYRITGPIKFHGSISRVIGMEAGVDISDPSGAFKNGTPIFDFGKTKTGTVVIERFFLLGGWEGPKSEAFFGNSGANTVIVQSIGMSGSIKAATGPAADWFVDDVSPGRQATLRIGPGETVWSRQYNPESPDTTMIDVKGGTFWLLGLKTEGRATHLLASDGAKAEILGGLSYQSWGGQKIDPPMFIVKDSAVSASIGVWSSNDPFSTIVEETQGGKTKKILPKDLPEWNMGLYRSGK